MAVSRVCSNNADIISCDMPDTWYANAKCVMHHTDTKPKSHQALCMCSSNTCLAVAIGNVAAALLQGLYDVP